MNDLLAEAREIISSNKTDKPARDFMTNEQRTSLADHYAEIKQFSAAAHFTPDANKRKEYDDLYREKYRFSS